MIFIWKKLVAPDAKNVNPGFYGYYLFPNSPGKVIGIENNLPSTSWGDQIIPISVKVGDEVKWVDSSVASSGFAIFQRRFGIRPPKIKWTQFSKLLRVRCEVIR